MPFVSLSLSHPYMMDRRCLGGFLHTSFSCIKEISGLRPDFWAIVTMRQISRKFCLLPPAPQSQTALAGTLKTHCFQRWDSNHATCSGCFSQMCYAVLILGTVPPTSFFYWNDDNMCGTIWDWYAEEKLSSEQKKSLSNAVTEKLQGPNSNYWKAIRKIVSNDSNSTRPSSANSRNSPGM